MGKFFSCDWGTSTFRLRLVDAVTQKILAASTSHEGISKTFARWKQSTQAEDQRRSFYTDFLMEQAANMAASFNEPLNDSPIILSGMASSSIGMVELPYKELPFGIHGGDLLTRTFPQTGDWEGSVVVVSGARTATDVLRGEETILVGCDVPNDDIQRLYILPGTHSKHLVVHRGNVQDFTTYMTGELFDLMSNKSILSSSIKMEGGEDEHIANAHFAEGVTKGAHYNLLNSMFSVRTKQLFNECTPTENYYYLSGLLIGYELSNINRQKPLVITVVAGEALQQKYIYALRILGLHENLEIINADEALVKGHAKIYNNLLEQ